MALTADTLTDEQKRQLYRDGYIIVKQAIAPELVAAARARMKSPKGGENLGSTEEMLNLVNASQVTPILHDVMGQFDAPIASQVGVAEQRAPGEHFNNLGNRDNGQPYYGAQLHMDGLCTIGVPQEVQQGSHEDIYNRYIASGPKGDLGRSPDVMGNNFVPLFQDPQCTLGMGSFTAFVFACLSDQMVAGCGQTALIPGAHHVTQEFFRWQRSQGDKMGPEGPGWPRIDYDAENNCGLVYLPQRVREQLLDDTCESTPDGRKWPRPTQILMEPGDVCITLFHMPHSGTRNENGSESRKNIIFRIRNKSRQPNHKVNGVSDHPDHGQMGEWLEYEEGNNPWERSKHHLCNMWDEWEGMQHIVREMQS